MCQGSDFVEMEASLLGLQVAPRSFDADKTYANAYFYLLVLCGIEGIPGTDIVARYFFTVVCVDFLAVVIRIPLCFYSFFGTLKFPIS